MITNKKTYPPGTVRSKTRSKTMRRRTTTDLAYDVCLKKYKNHDSNYIQTIKKVFNDYVNQVMEGIYEGKLFRIPMRLGHIIIKKSKSKKRIDWKNSMLLNTTIYYKNYNTDGYSLSFKWLKNDGYAMFKNMKLFGFYPTRGVKRNLNLKVKSQYTDYAIHTSKYDLVRLDKKHR